jgi:hypothetical protein
MAIPRSYPLERVRSGFTGELTSGTAAATRGSRFVAIVAIALLAVVLDAISRRVGPSGHPHRVMTPSRRHAQLAP